MASHHQADDRYSPGSSYQRRYDDGTMYDDRSRSPVNYHPRSRDRRSRSPLQGSATGDRRDRRREHSRDRDSRSNYRGRERERDDYYRRPSHSPSRRGRAGYRDRDRVNYRSPGYGSHSRSPSRSPSARRSRQSHPGPESREVILEGLPVDMVEEDISNELLDYYHVKKLEDVRVIRDRQTKISRQIGFLRFPSLDESREFIDRNFPFIHLYGKSSKNGDRAAKIRIAFSKEREDRRSKAEGEWICQNCSFENFSTRNRCFRCQATRSAGIPVSAVVAPKLVNSGDNDVAPDNTPSQFLLFRGLDGSVSEELFAKGVMKLYKPSPGTQSTSNNQKKGAKVASTTGDSNLGAKEGSLRRVLLVRDRKSNESWRYGFAEFATVDDAQAALTRLNSFEKFTISSKPVIASYIHAGVFVPVLHPTSSTARFTFSPLNKPDMKLAYWDDAGYVTELTVSPGEEEPPNAKSKGDQVENSNKAAKDGDKSKKRKVDAAAASGVKKIAMASHLQFWSDRHAELHGIQKKDDDDTGAIETASNHGSEEGSAPPRQSYADHERNCCYLCMRQFKTPAEVNRHERLSQLHRDNLQDEDLKAKATAKLIKHGITPSQSASEYRDRARERRQAFGSSKQASKAKAKISTEDEYVPTTQGQSKGAALLSKMGWSAGAGLGAQGTGVTAPIATEVYAQGVGLGAQGGKLGDAVDEANRNTRGRYDDFLEKTKDLARERYERMS